MSSTITRLFLFYPRRLASAAWVRYIEHVDIWRIVIADRSDLAANLYRLLLNPLGVELVVRKRFEEVRPHFFRRARVDLGIFNTNIFGKKFDEIYRRMESAPQILAVPKIFISRDTPHDHMEDERLEALDNSIIILRPFHPRDFIGLVQAVLKRGRVR